MAAIYTKPFPEAPLVYDPIFFAQHYEPYPYYDQSSQFAWAISPSKYLPPMPEDENDLYSALRAFDDNIDTAFIGLVGKDPPYDGGENVLLLDIVFML